MFIYITGPDGTGKSTQIKLLLEYLKGKGIKTRHLWLRYPVFFSFPFLVYARLRGFSWREEGGGVVHGFWDFRGSWLMEKVFPRVFLFDAALASLWKVYIPLWFGYTVVCERYVLDMLADIARATHNDSLFLSSVGRCFRKLIPKNNFTICLDLDVSDIRERRSNLVFDKSLESKVDVYRSMVRLLGLLVLSSEEPADLVQVKLTGLIYED